MALLANRAAWGAFVALIVVSPMRGRIVLHARRTGTLYRDYTDVLLFASDVALLLTVGLWLLSLTLDHRRVWFGPAFLRWPAVVVLVSAAVGIASAVDRTLTAYSVLRFVALAALAVFVVNEVGELARVVAPIAAMVVVQSVVGLAQVVGQRSIGIGWLGEHVLSPSLGVSVITSDDGLRTLRAYGLTDHPNILGGLLAMGVVLLVVAVGAPTVGRSRQNVASVAFALGVAALLVTFSRGAWIGVLVGLGVVMLMVTSMGDGAARRRLGGACLLGALAAAPFALAFRHDVSVRTSASRRSATEVRSVSERVALSDAATRIVSHHPLAGVGLGGLPVAMQTAAPALAYPYQPAAVVLLDVTAELGVVGGAAYFVAVVAPWIALLRRRHRWTLELALTSGALAVLTVVGLFDYYPWTYSAGRIWAWLVPALWAVTYRNATVSTDAV